MKSLLRSAAIRFGYELRKAPAPGYDSLSVFDLALRYMMLRRGEHLTFIEVGANDGESGDPLRPYIFRYPWRGVLVEPQPDIFIRLTAAYASLADRVSFENIGISDSTTSLTLYRLPPTSPRFSPFASTVVSSNPAVTARQLHVSTAELEEIHVPAMTLETLVEKYQFSEIDILQLDTEGFDFEVLKTLDLRRHRPILIRFEHGHLSPRVIGESIQHLNNHDYAVYFGGHQSDSVALRNDFLP
jgi:FkbM family methyltransferase